MTAGERRLAQRLIDKLEDDYLCWYDVPVGPKHRHPDFVILSPRRGLLVLEVKDWKLENIHEVNKAWVTLVTEHGMKQKPNPLEQARQYAIAIADLLERDVALRVSDGPHRGKSIVPWGYGVVLTKISRKAFEATDLGAIIHPALVICQDEMTESVEVEAFQRRLWAMFHGTLAHPLTMPQIDRVRWHLFPEVRIIAGQAALFPEAEQESDRAAPNIPDLVRVMDLQQEQLARSLGEGHRVIHGVAGSGKTMILGYRCAYLAKAMAKPILVLCFNVALAAKLRHFAEERGLGANVAVRNFHGWCMDQLKLYHVAKPESGPGFPDRLVQRVIEGVEKGQIPAAQYGAVLIDEAHDFEPNWLKVIVQMVAPETNSLLVLCDDAQSIYRKETRRKWSWASVGIQAKGRTTILRLNYRNTAEVLGVACEFAKEILTPEEAEEDGIPLVLPETAGRHGPVPDLVRLPSFKTEVRYLAARLHACHERGRAWNEMAVVYPAGFLAQDLVEGLTAADVPVEWLNRDNASRHFRPSDETVKVVTMHSSKGLEFPVVAIPGLGFMPYNNDPREEARLLYVAMTRAMDELLLTWSKESSFVERLRQARERLAA